MVVIFSHFKIHWLAVEALHSAWQRKGVVVDLVILGVESGLVKRLILKTGIGCCQLNFASCRCNRLLCHLACTLVGRSVVKVTEVLVLLACEHFGEMVFFVVLTLVFLPLLPFSFFLRFNTTNDTHWGAFYFNLGWHMRREHSLA